MQLAAAAVLVPFAVRQVPGPEETFRELEAKYGVRVVTGGGPYPVPGFHGEIRGADPDPRWVAWYAPLLSEEFFFYPREFVGRTGLRRIVLAEDLAFGKEARAAIPEFWSSTLYLDVAIARRPPPYLRRTLHHDFLHIVDYRDDGSVYADPDWADLNSPEFAYRRRRPRLFEDLGALARNAPGFLTAYATFAVEEDKAELFSWMMTEPWVVEERAGRDRILSLKVRLLRAQLRRFSPDLDRAFWERISARPRGRHWR